MPKRKYQTPNILHDAPLANDKAADFYFDDFAATLARLIASPATETPLAIGINGAWGSGKTSLLLRVKGMLDQPKTKRAYGDGGENFRVCKTVWFDAWKYNDEDKLLVALVRVILQSMKRDGFMGKLKAWLEDPRQSSYDVIAMFINAFEASFGGLGAEFKFKLDPKKHEQPSPFEKYTAFFDHFDDAFNALLKSWVGDGGVLVVFIDDLDRCLPAKTVQTLEAIKLFLDKSGCVFVLGADTRIVQAAVEKHYENAGITGESAKDYLEKVIQIRFDIPPIVEKAMENYLKEQDKSKVDEVMLKRWGALVAAAEVNPRRVKNVINDLNLQWFMAVNSGQAEGVNKDDFICWQALMRAAPAKFVTQVMDIEDVKLRHNFLMDALKWQNGRQEDKDEVKGYFSAYEGQDSKRLRRVLRQITFSKSFSPDALEAMIYLTSPPKVFPAGFTDQSPAEEDIIASAGPVVQIGETQVVQSDRTSLFIGKLEFLRIPSGRFVMGTKADSEYQFNQEKPQVTVDLNYDYWVTRYLITNAMFSEFISFNSYQTTAEKIGSGSFLVGGEWKNESGVQWRHPLGPSSDIKDKDNHPVVIVSWDDAVAYCQWFHHMFGDEMIAVLGAGYKVRLPLESEWEKAARGAYGNEWPWGNDFNKDYCNSMEGGLGTTSRVGSYTAIGGDSPYGCADMVGNVWEWCNDWFDPAQYKKNYSDLIKDPRGPSSGDARVLRGGAFNASKVIARCAYRHAYQPEGRFPNIGFRICLTPID